MFRKLILMSCLVATSTAFAQVSITPVKTTEKPADPQIDYTKTGAPLPPIKYWVFQDTLTKDTSGNKLQIVDAAATPEPKKRRKKHTTYAPTGRINAGITKPILTNDDLDNGYNLFLMMFNPTCSHCQEETRVIGKDADLFKRSKVYMVAAQVQAPYIPDFVKYTQFEQYPFYLGVDSSNFISKIFVYKALPQINIYDKNRKLLKIFSGEVPIDSLKPYIQ